MTEDIGCVNNLCFIVRSFNTIIFKGLHSSYLCPAGAETRALSISIIKVVQLPKCDSYISIASSCMGRGICYSGVRHL